MPITFTEIIAYFQIFEQPFDLQYITRLIQKIDSKYLAIVAKKNKSKNNA